jgi:hypothetical protein
MQVAFHCLPATLLFAVHVGNTHVSVWLNGKRYGVAASLCLVSYIYAPLGAIALLIVPFFQPSGLLFPLVLALKGHYWLIPLIVIMLFVGKKHLLKWAKSRHKSCGNDWFLTWTTGKICYMLKTYAFYFFRAIVPMAPTMYMSYNKKAGLSEHDNHLACKFDLASLAGAVIVLAIPLLYIQSQEIFFGAMWWLILISIWNNWKTHTVCFAERYMYLPNIGLLVTLCTLLNFIHPNAWMILFGIHAGMLTTYLPMYRNLKTYLKHHCNIDPTNDISWNFLCNLASGEGNAVRVLNLASEGLAHNDKTKLLWLHCANILFSFGRYEEALNAINKSRKHIEEKYTEDFINKLEILEQKILTCIKEK